MLKLLYSKPVLYLELLDKLEITYFLPLHYLLYKIEGQNVHRFAVRGELLERQRDSERETKRISQKHDRKRVTEKCIILM